MLTMDILAFFLTGIVVATVIGLLWFERHGSNNEK